MSIQPKPVTAVQTLEFPLDPEALERALGGRSLTSLATSMGITVSRLNNYTKGHRPMPYEYLVQLAALCNVPLHELTKKI